MAAVAQMMHVLPIGWVEPVDISNAVLFLASDEVPLCHRPADDDRRGEHAQVATFACRTTDSGEGSTSARSFPMPLGHPPIVAFVTQAAGDLGNQH